MKFSHFDYQRPNITQLKQDFHHLVAQFKQANSAAQQNEMLQQINQLRNHFETMQNIAYIRYSIDTANNNYQVEQDFFDENLPIYSSLVSAFYQELVHTPFKKELQKQWGKQLFDIAETTLKTFDPCIIEDLQKENKLSSEYTKLKASAKLNFRGEEHNLSSIGPFEIDADRATRKAANTVKWQFFADHADEFDRIFDELVKVRHRIAQKLGYDNFVQLGYNRMLRTDYDAKMVANFRQQVLEEIVPIAEDLRKRQAKRLGLDELFYYDVRFTFKSGNAKPKGDPEWIIAHGKKMYEELSEETGEFFNFMLENELMDLVTRKGKAGGGYCTYVNNYKSPYIFSNFNGTAHDITVLTHEAGHAFQVYMSRNFEMPEYNWPTYEACEIHSMSMEFLTWPWMNAFFEEETDKFKFEHLSESILFLPYGVAVDEFQHFVYENPTCSPTERKQAWREIERKYKPSLHYQGNAFLEDGGFWQKQSHIYGSPFYYIDYTLAQICAFQFWKKAEESHQSALQDYVKLCEAGGSKSFLELVDYANLHSPFQTGTLQSVVAPVKTYLNQVNDMVL